MSLSTSKASFWFFDFSEMPMLDPPAKTGAAPPSTPGSAKPPRSLACFSSTLQRAQLGAMNIAASPLLNEVHGSASLPSFGAVVAFSYRPCSSVSPLMLSADDSDATHLPSCSVAMSPPLAKIQLMPLRQSWPGSQNPEYFESPSDLSCVAAASKSASVV